MRSESCVQPPRPVSGEQVLFYTLSMLTGVLECGWIFYGVLHAFPLWKILLFPLAYHIGNLFPKPFSLNRTCLRIICATGLLSGLLSEILPAILPPPIGGSLHFPLTCAALILISAPIQSVRSGMKSDDSRVRTLKRMVRVIGFILAPLAVVIPTVLLTISSVAALYALRRYEGSFHFTRVKRPGGFNTVMLFQKMLEDMDMGYISTVIVKDSSRFGRNYLEVGQYTDYYFPENNIRFIAINDCVDSDNGEDDFGAFRNVMNEMYAKDISRKVRSSHKLRGNAGEPLSPPPYGYRKSPENPKKWVIDPEAAEVVRRIFTRCLEGKGNETIARMLQEDKVLVPQAYWQSKGIGRGGKKTQPNPCKWCKTTIARILDQQEYCGDIINFKTYSKSFRNKKRIENPQENWAVFKDVHEPIIDRDTWELVQKLTKSTKRRAPKPENGEKNMFCDLLYCADCRNKLWYNVNQGNRSIHYFNCSNYRGCRGTCNSTHYIRADSLEQVVMMELRRLADFLKSDEETFSEILEQKTNADMTAEQKKLESELASSEARVNDLLRLFEKLYEDNVSGKVTDEWFMRLSQKYETEQTELKRRILEIRERMNELQSTRSNKESFVRAVRKFMEMDHLTPTLLRELIDKIEVHQIEGTGKNRTQRIVIHYRFVGYIEIPFGPEDPHYTLESRQGVAVEYLPTAG